MRSPSPDDEVSMPSPSSPPLPSFIPCTAGQDPFVRQVQRALNHVATTGPIPEDGRYGASTQAAIRHVQRRAGLPPNGVLDAPTVQALLQRYSGHLPGKA